MMQANIFWLRDPRKIGLHFEFLKFLRFLDQDQVPTALARKILETQESLMESKKFQDIYDAGQYFRDPETRK